MFHSSSIASLPTHTPLPLVARLESGPAAVWLPVGTVRVVGRRLHAALEGRGAPLAPLFRASAAQRTPLAGERARFGVRLAGGAVLVIAACAITEEVLAAVRVEAQRLERQRAPMRGGGPRRP
jgi:hypothetical protein